MRTPWGDPDLQGVWTNKTVTPLERPAELAGKEFFGPEELAKFEQRYATPIEGLYLCGAGTHPGGGVTGAPGHNAARRILDDLRRRRGLHARRRRVPDDLQSDRRLHAGTSAR